MNTGTIKAVFPKYIYHRDDVCTNYLEKFKTRILQIQSDSGYKSNLLLNVKSTHQTNVELYKDPVFAPLVDEIYKSVMHFGTAMGYSPELIFKLSILNMWANVSGKGDYNFPHNHPGSLFSGAFYINATPENKIVFFDNYQSVDMPTSVDAEENIHVTYDCVPGRLVMFRGDLPHGNPPQVGDGEKIIISFNMARSTI
jgi:uncharacterized protein (TIGR02466 family)